MKSNPDAVVSSKAIWDEQGTNEYNLALGDRRARTTMNYLLAHGVPASRISLRARVVDSRSPLLAKADRSAA